MRSICLLFPNLRQLGPYPICLLTYDAPHRRTQDLTFRLLAHGIRNIYVVGTPWVYRKNHIPLVPHRPAEPNWPAEALDVPPLSFFSRLGIPYTTSPYDTLNTTVEELGASLVLVGGAGILSKEFVEAHTVLNLHCGYIPYGRGLDALKWCVYHDLPIGVTAHIVDDRCDAGKLVLQKYVPIYPTDTFGILAHRQYEMELGLALPAIMSVLASGKEGFEDIDVGDHPAYRRMPNNIELEMLKKFADRRSKDGSSNI